MDRVGNVSQNMKEKDEKQNCSYKVNTPSSTSRYVHSIHSIVGTKSYPTFTYPTQVPASAVQCLKHPALLDAVFPEVVIELRAFVDSVPLHHPPQPIEAYSQPPCVVGPVVVVFTWYVKH